MNAQNAQIRTASVAIGIEPKSARKADIACQAVRSANYSAQWESGRSLPPADYARLRAGPPALTAARRYS